ncbi:MAG: hypothetical protein AB4352_28520 [Hormoscilla sp.]
MNYPAGDQLRRIALQAQKHPRQSKGRRIFLTRLICEIQQTGQLSRADNEALDRTFFAICHQIDEYDETKEVMDWAKELFEQQLEDAIVETL